MNFPTLAALLCLVAGPLAAEGFPVTITHAFGETTIETEPQRIVAVGYRDSDFLYALGVAPVGVRDWWGGHPYAAWPWAEAAREATGATPEVFSGDDLDYEAIAALDPDLILGVYLFPDQDVYDKLAAIAPVVTNPPGYPMWGVPWTEEIRLFDLATSGSTDKAEAIISELDAQLAQAVADYPQLQGKTGTIVYLTTENELRLWGSTDVASRFLANLGLVFPAELDALAAEDSSISVSLERFDMIDQDVMVWPIENRADQSRERVEEMDLYQLTNLAREGRSVWLDDPDGALAAALSYQSPLSISMLLEVLPPLLAAAVDGDPTTEVPPALLPAD